MADSRLHDGEPKKLELYPVPWTFAERLPKAEVDAFIATNRLMRLHILPFEEARIRVAKYYFNENQNRLKDASPAQRDQYYSAQQTMQRSIDKEKNGDDGRVFYRKRKDELLSSMQGSLSEASAKIIEQNAKALVEVNRLLSIEDQDKQQKELREFLRTSARQFNEANKEWVQE